MRRASGTAPKSALFIVFLVVVIDLLGFGIVLPLLPLFGERLRRRPRSAGKADSSMVGAVVGLLMASFSAMQFLFAPLWGRVSDRVGRRPILLVGLAGLRGVLPFFGYASDLPAEPQAGLALTLLFIARIGAGIAGATIATAQAVIADCTPPERTQAAAWPSSGRHSASASPSGPLVGFASLVYFPNHHGADRLHRRRTVVHRPGARHDPRCRRRAISSPRRPCDANGSI